MGDKTCSGFGRSDLTKDLIDEALGGLMTWWVMPDTKIIAGHSGDVITMDRHLLEEITGLGPDEAKLREMRGTPKYFWPTGDVGTVNIWPMPDRRMRVRLTSRSTASADSVDYRVDALTKRLDALEAKARGQGWRVDAALEAGVGAGSAAAEARVRRVEASAPAGVRHPAWWHGGAEGEARAKLAGQLHARLDHMPAESSPALSISLTLGQWRTILGALEG